MNLIIKNNPFSSLKNLITSSIKLNHSKSKENKFEGVKKNDITNANIILDINGKDFLESHEKNEQLSFYDEKDIEEDKELLGLFQIYQNVNNKSCNKNKLIKFLFKLS